MAKVNIPIGLDGSLDYTDESKHLNTLIYTIDRTNSGQSTFTSLSSQITYNTEDYPDNPEIFNRGDVGMIHLLQTLYGGQDGFLMMAEDYNNVVVNEVSLTIPAASWAESGTEGIWSQTLSVAQVKSTSKCDLKANYTEYAAHINELYVQLFVDNPTNGGITIYAISQDKPTSDYSVILTVQG